MKLNASAVSILALAGIALASQPALSQSAMGKGPAPGGPVVAPASSAPPAPQAPALIPSIPAPSASAPKLIRGQHTEFMWQGSPVAPGETGTHTGNGGAGTSNFIFDRWGNLFIDTPKLHPASGVGLNATGPGQSLNTSTDARGAFTLPKLAEGVHQLQLNVGDLDNLRSTGRGGPTGGGPQAMHGSTAIVAILAIAIPGTGNQSVGFAREIPEGTKMLQVKVSVDRNGNAKAVDLGDGAGLVDVSRGKVLPGTNRGSALVGRVALLQE